MAVEAYQTKLSPLNILEQTKERDHWQRSTSGRHRHSHNECTQCQKAARSRGCLNRLPLLVEKIEIDSLA
jgi:hypothetical protein